jgi:hypothetical protein
MRKSTQNKKKSVLPFMLLLILSFVMSIGASFFYLKDKFSFESSLISVKELQGHEKGDENAGERQMRLYKPIERDLPIRGGTVLRKDTLLVMVEDFIRKRVEPYRVDLLDLYLDREGVIYIDFGSEIKKNFRGDAYEELSILAGLYKGIKETVPGLTAMKLLIEGKEEKSFGGHIDISRPIGDEVTYNVQ